MLLPFVADVKATVFVSWTIISVDGNPLSFDLKTDVIAFIYIGRCYDQCVADLFLTNVGWCYCLVYLVLEIMVWGWCYCPLLLWLMLLPIFIMADVIAMWQMLGH